MLHPISDYAPFGGFASRGECQLLESECEGSTPRMDEGIVLKWMVRFHVGFTPVGR